MRRTVVLCSGLVLAAACRLEEPEGSSDALTTCEGDAHCSHLLDRIVIPKLRAAQIAPREGDAPSVCRRMAIDLVGRIPSVDELDRCVAQTSLAKRADMFMDMKEYVRVQQRSWAETLGFNTFLLWYGYAVDFDKDAGRLYGEGQGALDYPTFTAKIVQHPGFYGLHQGDDWGSTIFNVFLGRTARPDELASIRPLTKLFDSRAFCDAGLWKSYYSDAIADDRSPTDAANDAYGECVDTGTEEYVYSFCACARGEASIGCRSDVFGPTIDMGQDGCDNPESEDETANYHRADGETVPGTRTSCSGSSCKDKIVDEAEHVAGDLRPLAVLNAAQAAHMDKLGAAIVTRPDFWEAGADREIGRLIGWWKDGVRRPDFDLPEVRTALAAELKRTGSLRAIQKLIVTSLLYTAPLEPPPDFHPSSNPSGPGMTEPPLWSMGSTKLLTAENWLDSAGVATFGQVVGFCDYRFVGLGEVGPIAADPTLILHLAPPQGASFDDQRYYVSSVRLGGCSAEQARPKKSTVGITYAQHDLARSLCASGSVLPHGFDGSEASMKSAITGLVRRTLSRDATNDEVAELADEAKQCRAAAGGCSSPEASLRWLCTRLVDSAAFALY